MNERGLAVGEMGGRGEGHWDGEPMTFLLRDIMEHAATVDEALAILRRAPRTCEYYYVLSDKTRAMAAVHCRPEEMVVLRPGQQHPRLPLVPRDTVLISGGQRAKLLSQRLQKEYGRIDAPGLMEIIKRPVAMDSNLHDAVFAPETWSCGSPMPGGGRRPATSPTPISTCGSCWRSIARRIARDELLFLVGGPAWNSYENTPPPFGRGRAPCTHGRGEGFSFVGAKRVHGGSGWRGHHRARYPLGA